MDHLEETNSQTTDDGWGGLAAVDGNFERSLNPYVEGDPDEIIPEADLPFIRFKLPPEEEDPQSIRTSRFDFSERRRGLLTFNTVDAWVVDIPKPQHITVLLK